MIDRIIDYNRQFVADKNYERYLTDKYPDKKLGSTCKFPCLGIDIREPVQEEFDISDSMQSSSEGFDFGIKTFSRSIS